MVHKKIGEILVGLGHISPGEVELALNTQRSEPEHRRIGEIMVGTSITEEQLYEALSHQKSIPLMDESQVPENIPLEKVSFEFLKQNLVLPLSHEGNTLNVAIADPTRTEAIESLKATFDYNITLFLAPASVIQEHIDTLQASKEAVMQRLLEGVGEEESQASETLGEISHLKDIAQEKGIIQLANLIIENAVKENASDIHVEPEETDVRVRYRIDGILYDREILPVKTQAALSSRIKLLSRMNIAERRLPQDGRIKGRFSSKEVDIRVSTLPTVYGESIVMRLLDKEASLMSLEDLGYDELFLNKYQELILRPYGMILMTGPTGSGKTTTLYASLDKINSPDKKIITIEEPVEYLLKGISQIQVRPKIGLTFADGLRHIVRQDPDVIMVGEIRDIETASIAVHASLTGHLLFSTLHTNDAPSAVTRLIEMGVEHYLVSSTLIGALAQRLVRKICPGCKEPVPVPDNLRGEFSPSVQNLWHGKGCEQCMNTGYRGRIAIFELLVVDDQISALIGNRASVRKIRDAARATGMRTLREDGMLKAVKGITTVDEVLRVTQAELPA